MEVIINLKLNDTLIINNQAFKINSITTNLQTEMSELELLNVVNNYLPLSLSLDNVYQTLGIYYTYYYSNSIGIASNLSNGDIIYTDSNLTNTLSAGTYYQGGGTESTRVCDFGGSITVNSVGQITSIDCAQP
jgi:hypothetical protein